MSVPPPPPPTPPPPRPQGDGTGGLIPYKNAPALVAYYTGIFSFICYLGFPLAVAAVILGVMGLKKRKQQPEVSGAFHAWTGIICGSVFGLMNLLIIIFTIVGAIVG